ncbi:BadF/BadG/BcrA/BcrD ATPase family protein [Paenibacillus sp. LHD-117]|uniref:N-acetylglucosamine kinase n=1 Tax=Paenibacillus sp. LHD-117 TaxID=3071412 RepID=UPI0027E14FFC|nr:BadF/BadG/BcrA/BcrD ATPase family protein [Paenibacillus sp. LHD-117]MDQ6418767.1 BadF/BadG/BcrA/BcrD ATPase family protein [Paenibacillus sp. LHD-117]
MRYVVGLDGGGTKTAVTVADESGALAHAFTAGPLNLNGQDEASVRSTLSGICAEIARVLDGGLNSCAVMCVGAAGISNPNVSGRLTDGLRQGGFRGELLLVGDHETALWGAHEGPHGMILIAGTGSIAFGRNADGEVHRAGGFGHLIDDEGSGYSIGRDLLSAVVRASDGREAPTVLTELVYERLGVSTVQELVGYVYAKDRNKADIAALAPLLSVACEAGDAAALRIAERNAAALVDTASAVAERLGLAQGGELALLGSVLLQSSQVRAAFEAGMAARHPRLRCIDAKRDAAYGAVLLALAGLRGER